MVFHRIFCYFLIILENKLAHFYNFAIILGCLAFIQFANKSFLKGASQLILNITINYSKEENQDFWSQARLTKPNWED